MLKSQTAHGVVCTCFFEIEGKFGTYHAFIWLFRASLFAWTNLLSTYSLIIHHLCVQKITKIQNYIKKYLMRTKSLFDYDHEGTKNNKNDMFNYTQVYTKKYSYPKSVSFLSKKVTLMDFRSSIFRIWKMKFYNAGTKSVRHRIFHTYYVLHSEICSKFSNMIHFNIFQVWHQVFAVFFLSFSSIRC